jgi:hypothetical protein
MWVMFYWKDKTFLFHFTGNRSKIKHESNLESEGAVLADEAVAGDVATAPASVSQSLIIGALEHLFKTGCGREGGSTSIE